MPNMPPEIIRSNDLSTDKESLKVSILKEIS
jgi:hypothetical protein